MEKYKGDDPLAQGMRELLRLLPEDTLKTFLGTVTGYLVRYGSVPINEDGIPTMDPRTHAIQTIMMYSEPYDLLGRQKMTKGILSQYLNQKGVRMTMPASKKSLCHDVLRHWGVEAPANLTIREYETATTQKEVKDVKRQINSYPSPSASSSSRVGSGSERIPTTPTSPKQSLQSQPFQSVPVEQAQNANSSAESSSAVAVVSNQELEQMECENNLSLRRQEAVLGLQLGNEFSKWFYERLNTLTDFTPSHFWPECNFRLEMILAAHSEHTLIDEIFGNAEISCAKLKDLVVVKQLYFNPNTMGNGVRGYLSPHGLAQVFVCGTIHQKENMAPLGVFEQMFGLMKDPRFGNNYKIKFTVLRLREGSHLAIQNSPPELCDSSLVGIIEEVDD